MADVPPGGVDLVVALTSHNDVKSIGAVARAVRDGVEKVFGSRPVRYVLADAGSTDGTREAVREIIGVDALLDVPYERGAQLGELPYHGLSGRAAALRAIFETARGLGAKACVAIDGGLLHVQPAWIDALLTPVLSEDFDYVSPYYFRHVHEGAITKGVVYPMARALYGVRLRQPAGTEFACSGRLIEHYLQQSFWDAEHASVGIDLWLALAAVAGEFRTCEALLGARGGSSRVAPSDPGTTIAQVVGALFEDVEHNVEAWQRARASHAAPVFGDVADPGTVTPIAVDGLMESFRFGYRELREIWTWALPPRTIVELRKLTEVGTDQFRFDDRLWASIVYDFAIGHFLRVMPREHLLRSLTPLYTGWLASLVLQMGTASHAEVDARVERLCVAFEAEKRHLISRWRWPERLRR